MGSEPSESPNWLSIIRLANCPSRNSPTDSSDESKEMTYQATTINAVRSDRVVIGLKLGDIRRKAFQVSFGKDGSLYVSFPYYRHRDGVLAAAILKADGKQSTQVNMEEGGKVTSHRVKYSHHPDGRAHFSQDGKIFTAIKRQSVALATQRGHIFSLIIKGLDGLDAADEVKDAPALTTKRSVIQFEPGPCETVKFVGRWLDPNEMRFFEPTTEIGPIIPTTDPQGVVRFGFLLANPYANAKHVLLVTYDVLKDFGTDPEVFLFHAGFDPIERMTDVNQEAGFLIFKYPIPEPDKAKERIGSVDYVPNTQAQR